MKKPDDVKRAWQQGKDDWTQRMAEIRQQAHDGTLPKKDWNAKPANPPPKDWNAKPDQLPPKDWSKLGL